MVQGLTLVCGGDPQSHTIGAVRSFALTYAEILVGSYYRRFRLGEEVPASGGLVIYTNHSNGLVDGQLPLFLTNRQQYILAKASLFKIPILNWVIRHAGAIPIYRQKDNVDMARNEDSFREVHARLLEGGALVIYPEGESRLGYRLRPFKTGAARMGLGAQAKALQRALEGGSAPPIRFQPILFVYEEQETFRSRAHLWVGRSFDVREWAEAYAQEERETVRQVTQALKERLESASIPVETREEFRFLVHLDRLLHAAPEGAPKRLRDMANAWPTLQQTAPERCTELSERVARHTRRLNRLGLEGYDLTQSRWERTGPDRARALLALGTSYALLPIWLPPILLARAIANIGRSTPDKLVTVTVLASSVFVPLWIVGLSLWSSQFTSGWAVFGVLVVWAALALRWIRSAGRPRPLRRACTRLGLQGSKQTVDSLWIEKQSLCQEWRALLQEANLADPSAQTPR